MAETLTEMLGKEYEAVVKLTEDDARWLSVWVTLAKVIFKNWLRSVGLPRYTSSDGINVTEAIRQLLITLVDEP